MPTVHPGIGLFGSGAVAQALGRALHAAGLPVVALAARDAGRAARAARFVGPDVPAVDAAGLIRLSRRLIVAVSDEAIPHVAEMLAAAGLRSGIVLHTCGSRGPDALGALAAAGVACGVLHPLQTVPTPAEGAARLRGITYAVGGDAAATAFAEELAGRLASRTLRVAPHGFPAYHAAAALAGNAVTALVDASVALMGRAGIDRREAVDAIGPLCRTSLENVLVLGAEAALTGPVARGDAQTIEAHLDAVAGASGEVADLYRAAARCLVQIATRRGLAESAAARITLLLDRAEMERT